MVKSLVALITQTLWNGKKINSNLAMSQILPLSTIQTDWYTETKSNFDIDWNTPRGNTFLIYKKKFSTILSNEWLIKNLPRFFSI